MCIETLMYMALYHCSMADNKAAGRDSFGGLRPMQDVEVFQPGGGTRDAKFIRPDNAEIGWVKFADGSKGTVRPSDIKE